MLYVVNYNSTGTTTSFLVDIYSTTSHTITIVDYSRDIADRLPSHRPATWHTFYSMWHDVIRPSKVFWCFKNKQFRVQERFSVIQRRRRKRRYFLQRLV